jgi:hypothetical protein
MVGAAGIRVWRGLYSSLELQNLAFSEKGGKRDNQRQSQLADIEQLLA